jgi:hypothetical protein
MKITTFYFNGCSHTAGGGLYEPGIKNLYKKFYNVEWGHEKTVTYPKYVSEYFDVKRVDESTCGSGAPRLVRKTFDYIKKVGLDESRKTLFFLQINNSVNRIEYFSKEINDYLVINLSYHDNGELNQFDIVDNWSLNDRKNTYEFYDGKIKERMREFISNHHDPIVYQEKTRSDLIGLLSFMDSNNINYLIFPDDDNICEPFDEIFMNDKHVVSLDGCLSVHGYSLMNKNRIADELGYETMDFHPGYYGHQIYSKKLIKFLKEKGLKSNKKNNII